ncbi:MAG: dihydroneopterin aldolase [Rikenellaceae bacterium]|nr:dihydroneopterin aldolase [Rikenellaceae bacterium]
MKYCGAIELEEMEFYAFHGCYELEKKVGNHFRVSLRMEADLDLPALSDRVQDSVNYVEAYQIVAAEMANPSNILEHVAARILEAVYDRFPQLKRVTVKVSKLAPPVGGPVGKTLVELTR